MTLKNFFEKTPPYSQQKIDDLNIDDSFRAKSNSTTITLHCDICDGERVFYQDYTHLFSKDENVYSYHFICRNCRKYSKIITVIGKTEDDSSCSGHLIKIGEYPPFGEPTPAKFINMIGPAKDIFLKGRRCENQSLGIGAYAYYRRIVESQKNRIIDRIIEICRKIPGQEKLIKDLEKAKSETQFSKAIDSIKEELPSSLLISGENPLKLIHKVLSKGIHDKTDEECLTYANSIRVVLVELCHRINELQKDDKELIDAISFLSKI